MLTKEERLELFKQRYPTAYKKLVSNPVNKIGKITLRDKKIQSLKDSHPDLHEVLIHQSKQEMDSALKVHSKSIKSVKRTPEEFASHQKAYYAQWYAKNAVRYNKIRSERHALKPKKPVQPKPAIYFILKEFNREKRKIAFREKSRIKYSQNKPKMIEKSRKSYQKRKEKHKAHMRQYAKDNREKIRAMQNSYLIRFPEKTKARALSTKAVKQGLLIKKPCEVCQEQRVHAHHDDYNFPLQVRWLCPTHHRYFHRDHSYDEKTFTYKKI